MTVRRELEGIGHHDFDYEGDYLLVDEWLRRQWYQGILGRFAASAPELPGTPELVEAFLGGLRVGNESRRGYFRALKALFNWCEKRYGVANPIRVVAPPRRSSKLPRTLSSAEIGCLFLVPLPKRDRALITLLLDTGVRIGEAVGLRVQDIGLETILVDGKTGPREVPLSEGTRRQLLDLAREGYVFPGWGGHISVHQGYYIVRRAFLAASIKGRKLGPHTLRHTFGRYFIMAGGDAFSLQKILGHTDIQTTRIYVELNTRDIVRQHHKFTPIRPALAPTQGRLIDEVETIIRTISREEGA